MVTLCSRITADSTFSQCPVGLNRRLNHAHRNDSSPFLIPFPTLIDTAYIPFSYFFPLFSWISFHLSLPLWLLSDTMIGVHGGELNSKAKGHLPVTSLYYSVASAGRCGGYNLMKNLAALRPCLKQVWPGSSGFFMMMYVDRYINGKM